MVEHIQEKPSIQKLSENLFQLGHEHEIEGDIFDMEFTPNRGDCLSLNGLLRDLAVFYTINSNQKIYTKEIDQLSIDFENLADDICTHITFLKLEISDIPEQYNDSMNKYFKDLDISKNNFFTDVSNYLSYETGQPTHCYDESKIKGKFTFEEINISNEFETLFNKKINLSKKNAVFLLDGEVINLAGVIGGKNTACSSTTKTVLVECAYFRPEAIIGKSVRYDIKSEAAHKFERGVDPECHDEVLRRFIKIVSDHANIKSMSIVSHKARNRPIYKIPISVNKINQIIGLNLSKKEYLGYLVKLGFIIEGNSIIPPSYRADIQTNNDLAEEVARVVGYNNIERLNINIPKNTEVNRYEIENKIKYFLLDHGFYEVINSPFVGSISKKAIKVDNPLDSNREYLRTNITNSLLDNLLYNEKRQQDSVKLFEISDIYYSDSDNGQQKKRMLSIIASGKVGLNYEDFSKKINEQYLVEIFHKILPNHDLVFHKISRDNLDTKIKNEIISFEIDIKNFSTDTLLYKEISRPPKGFIQYSPISEQPSSIKDISFLIKDYSKTRDLQDLLLSYTNEIVKQVYIFDYFVNEKRGEIKIGFRFIFQSKITTLTTDEIDIVYNEIVEISHGIKGIMIPGIK